MPKRIKLTDGAYSLVDDAYTYVADDEGMAPGDVIVSLTRFQSEGEQLLAEGRSVGVKLQSDEEVEALAYDLARISVVALVFPKFSDGRAFTSATLLRKRYGYTGEIRAVGDVLRENAGFMVRCGMDAFEASDGSTPEQWAHAANRHRHVYQRAADARVPAFEEREG